MPCKSSSVIFCSNISCSDPAQYFQGQWSHHLVLQQARCLTDITLQLKDGSISLHQAVLLPLSPLLSVTTSLLMKTDTPLVILLPDYQLSTAHSLVSLLYTGSCLIQSTASYNSILSLLSCLGLTMSPTSSVLSTKNSSGYHHKKFRAGTASDDYQEELWPHNLLIPRTSSKFEVSTVRQDHGSGHNYQAAGDYVEDVFETICLEDGHVEGPGTEKTEARSRKRSNSESEAKTSLAGVCSLCLTVTCVCTTGGLSGRSGACVDSDLKVNSSVNKSGLYEPPQQVIINPLEAPKFNIKYRVTEQTTDPKLLPNKPSQKSGKSCPVCGIEVSNGMFKYRSHLVEKHYYKQLSAMVGMRVRQCPVCDKTFKMRGNLVKHYGILHKFVDQLLNVDGNQNPILTNTSTKITDNIKELPSLVCHEESLDKEKTSAASVPDLPLLIINQPDQFPCSLCPSVRKTQFRLLQHYCLAHFRTKLEDQFGLQFVTNNGCCPVCKKNQKNLRCFLLHIGAAHAEVVQYLTTADISEVPNIKSQEFTWLCSSDSCKSLSFPNKCNLMRHYTLKHHSQQLAAVLQPQFAESGNCQQCGKLFCSYPQFMLHCSVTHRLVLSFCSQAELASLQGQHRARPDGGRVKKREEGRPLYTCKLCGNTFFNNYLLMKHYTAKHYFDSLCADFAASMSSGECQQCGQKHPAWRMVQHLGVTHNEVARYVGVEEGTANDK
eukprot:GFUD01018736.1.p1 GENE.GFUD01018736.1~~GFUD01018736.1.p1  ORF type:complete len:717 (-),score=168.59 GFUD01018736.1:33-2183(-)